MFDEPNKSNLLRATQRALASVVLPQLDGRAREDLQMALDALAIADREINTGTSGVGRILDLFSELYGEDNVTRAGEDAVSRIRGLNKDLARDIREGTFAMNDAKVSALINEQICYRISLSNPGFLSDGKFSQPGQP